MRECERCGGERRYGGMFCRDCAQIRRDESNARSRMAPELVRIAVDMAMGRVPDNEEEAS